MRLLLFFGLHIKTVCFSWPLKFWPRPIPKTSRGILIWGTFIHDGWQMGQSRADASLVAWRTFRLLRSRSGKSSLFLWENHLEIEILMRDLPLPDYRLPLNLCDNGSILSPCLRVTFPWPGKHWQTLATPVIMDIHIQWYIYIYSIYNITARHCVLAGRFKWRLNMFTATLTLRRVWLQVAMKIKLMLLPQSTYCS